MQIQILESFFGTGYYVAEKMKYTENLGLQNLGHKGFLFSSSIYGFVVRTAIIKALREPTLIFLLKSGLFSSSDFFPSLSILFLFFN